MARAGPEIAAGATAAPPRPRRTAGRDADLQAGSRSVRLKTIFDGRPSQCGGARRLDTDAARQPRPAKQVQPIRSCSRAVRSKPRSATTTICSGCCRRWGRRLPGRSTQLRCPLCPRYCCKSRKSNNPKNLAKVDLWTSLSLRRFSTPVRRSVIDFG
jgi:hypothetical protein